MLSTMGYIFIRLYKSLSSDKLTVGIWRPAVVLVSTSEPNRSGHRETSSRAIMPPIETPSRWMFFVQPKWSIRSITSCAICEVLRILVQHFCRRFFSFYLYTPLGASVKERERKRGFVLSKEKRIHKCLPDNPIPRFSNINTVYLPVSAKYFVWCSQARQVVFNPK